MRMHRTLWAGLVLAAAVGSAAVAQETEGQTSALEEAAQGEGITVGPILLGAAKPVHILTPSATVRRFVNITALAVAQAAGRTETVSVTPGA